MREGAWDFGGPRNEFFRLVLKEIKEKLVDNGLTEAGTLQNVTIHLE